MDQEAQIEFGATRFACRSGCSVIGNPAGDTWAMSISCTERCCKKANESTRH